MKSQGIIINTENPHDVEKLGCTWNYDDQEPDFDELQDAIYERTEKLEGITKKFMCGDSDAQSFFFVDTEEGAAALKSVFPEFELLENDPNSFPLDYNYHRDL